MQRVAALLAALLTSLAVMDAAPAASAEPTFVINGDTNIGGFSLTRSGTLNGAIAVYGRPTSREVLGYDTCSVSWGVHGIKAEFSYNYTEPCALQGRHAETTLTGRQWRTARGLRIGDTLQRLRRLYPRAKPYVAGSWTLLSRPFAGVRLPTVLATVKSGRVTTFVVRSPWLF